MRRALFCSRLNSSVEVRFQQYQASVGYGLAKMSRIAMADNLDLFDFFVYSENDMVPPLPTPSHTHSPSLLPLSQGVRGPDGFSSPIQKRGARRSTQGWPGCMEHGARVT